MIVIKIVGDAFSLACVVFDIVSSACLQVSRRHVVFEESDNSKRELADAVVVVVMGRKRRKAF